MSDEAQPSERLLQVVFDLPESPDGGGPPVTSERLWAAKTQVKLHLEVRNVPFYVGNIAYGDVVLVRPDNERREIVYERLISESGHSTVRLLIKEPEVRRTLDDLLSAVNATWEMGCSDAYWAVDVKPEVDYSALRAALINLKDSGAIGVQESAISHHHQAQLPSFP